MKFSKKSYRKTYEPRSTSIMSTSSYYIDNFEQILILLLQARTLYRQCKQLLTLCNSVTKSPIQFVLLGIQNVRNLKVKRIMNSKYSVEENKEKLLATLFYLK